MLSQNTLVNQTTGECDGWNSSLKLLSPNKTHIGGPSDTTTSGHYWLPPNSARRHFRGQMCVGKDGGWLSLQGWQEKREEGEKSSPLLCLGTKPSAEEGGKKTCMWFKSLSSQSWFLLEKSDHWNAPKNNTDIHLAHLSKQHYLLLPESDI